MDDAGRGPAERYRAALPGRRHELEIDGYDRAGVPTVSAEWASAGAPPSGPPAQTGVGYGDTPGAAADVPGPGGRVPAHAAWLAGAVAEAAWAVTGRRSTPPLTRFLTEQLTTAHWFDQRRTRTALDWRPEVGLDEGFARLAAWYGGGDVAA